MGNWTLTLVGQEVGSDLGPAFNAFVDELNKAGHRIVTARVRTDNGENTIDLPALLHDDGTTTPAPVPDPSPAPVEEDVELPLDESDATPESIPDPPATPAEGATHG